MTPLRVLILWFGATTVWWWLAFVPLQAPPGWLVTVREVCFGSRPNGLPDASGWIMLTIAPASMLAALLIIWWKEWLDCVKERRGRRILAALLLLLVSGVAWAGRRIYVASASTEPALDSAGEGSLPTDYPQLNTEAADFRLIDQSGVEVALSGFRPRPVLLTFAFAHCQTVCPLLVRRAMAALPAAADAHPALVIVTLDPWRDTPGALPSMASEWGLGEGMHVVSGSVADVEKTLESYNVARERNEDTGDVVHPALVYVIDDTGRIAYAFNNPTVSWLAEALRRAARTDEAPEAEPR